jgi:hypothetical protein
MVTNLLQVLSEVEVLVEESIDERSAGFITQVAVRSAIYKQCTGGLVVRWVTTSESPLLYIFDYLFFCVVGCVIVVVRLIGYDLRIMNQAIEANVPDLNF